MIDPCPALAITDCELRSLLRDALLGSGKGDSPIVSLRRQPWDYYSSFAMEALEIVLEDRSSLSLVVKNVGARGKLHDASAVKPDFLYNPLREIEVYRDYLDLHHIDAPRYFGAAIDLPAGRALLFLENVRGFPLWQQGEIEVWCEVARWLGSFHGRCDLARVSKMSHLLRYDRAYYAVWSERAVDFSRQAPSSSAERVEAVEMLAARHARVIDRLLALPSTLIHGECVASNILIQREGDTVRPRPVDWEMAAIGPGLFDLADLTAGKWDADQKQRIADAYRQALPAALRMSAMEFAEALDLCRLHRSMQWLGWAPNWVPPKEHSHDWLAEGRQLAGKLET